MREHTLNAVVGDWETITVPAGTFKAIKITTNTEVVDTATGEKKSGVDTSWYSPDAKKTVKTVATSKKADGGEDQQEILLVSLRLNSSYNSEKRHTLENKRIGPQRRYIDNYDGTVTDSVTNLIWMKCAVGQTWSGDTCTGKAKEISWIEANRYCTEFAGYNDWRLPDIDELSTIVYCSNGNPDYYSNGKNANSDINDWGCFGKPGKDHNRPTIAQDVFPNCPSSLFWSKSRDIQFSGPYGVYFGYGSISNANDTGITHARLVRKD